MPVARFVAGEDAEQQLHVVDRPGERADPDERLPAGVGWFVRDEAERGLVPDEPAERRGDPDGPTAVAAESHRTGPRCDVGRGAPRRPAGGAAQVVRVRRVPKPGDQDVAVWANSDVVVLANTTPPASSTRCSGAVVAVGTNPVGACEPSVEGTPASH